MLDINLKAPESIDTLATIRDKITQKNFIPVRWVNLCKRLDCFFLFLIFVTYKMLRIYGFKKKMT